MWYVEEWNPHLERWRYVAAKRTEQEANEWRDLNARPGYPIRVAPPHIESPDP